MYDDVHGEVMERISLSLTKLDKNRFERVSKLYGVSKSELLRRWIDKAFLRYCPLCPDGVFFRCDRYQPNEPIESRCMTDSSVGFCILERDDNESG